MVYYHCHYIYLYHYVVRVILFSNLICFLLIGCYIRLDNNDFVNNNEIRFFKNGVDQGVAFKGVTRALYFPAISIYMGVRT